MRLKHALMIPMVTSFVFALAAFLSIADGLANDVPAQLPRPDQTPPADGKVKVYILAGQSNMVGFGYLDNARPVYDAVYLSADPNIKIGRMPIGNAGLLRHGMFQSDRPDAQPGAKVAIYQGSYQQDVDYSKQKPIQQTTVALGHVDQQLPTHDQPHTLVAKAWIEVPVSGTFELHAGFESSSKAIVTLNEKEVYRKGSDAPAKIAAVELEQGKRYPIQVTYLAGGSAAFWMKQIELSGKGDLRSLTNQGRFPWFVDTKGEWAVRNDVTYWETRISKQAGGSGGPLSATSNGKFIGPEVPFGFVMGTHHQDHVLLIESSMGNRALSFDFRPPSSGKTEEEKTNQFCGAEYDLMVKGVRETLANIENVVPNYQGQGYEIAGFVWFQGHKDKGVPKEVYEKHLVNLIGDLKKEFDAPELKTVVATVGFGGMEMEPGHKMTWDAQMAVGDPQQHPELKGQVASVDTRPFWRNRGQSPTNTGYHYNHNAEFYVLTGDALGRAMVRLTGGSAQPLAIPKSTPQHPDEKFVYSDEVTGRFNKRGPHYDAAYYRQMGSALKPIIMEEMVPGFLDKTLGPKSRGNLKTLVRQQRPAKDLVDIRSDLDTLIDYYDMAGVSDFQWRPFCPELKNADWFYYSFDPAEPWPAEKSNRWRKITYPKGMAGWFQNDFDPAAAGWQIGAAPFGRMGDKLDRRRPKCNGSHCGCCEMPKTLWEHEVLLMRQTFDVPPLEDDHVYRLILGGAGCDRSGEAFAIYVNGKPLTQVDGGFYRYTGIRGGYLHDEILKEFKTGKVTISIINFLRYTHFRDKTTYFGPYREYYAKPVPPNGHVNVWMEAAKLSPSVLEASRDPKPSAVGE